ncbi:MAG: DUF3392 domain-containing protein [Verrucomicrobia bacterium]|nr:DUF3392 domain-containing protein [Verrucomicrobiota bacterium]
MFEKTAGHLQYSRTMNFLYDAIRYVSHFMQDFTPQISMAIAATIFFIYGGNIHGAIRTSMQKLHFLVRLSLFTLICAFGYGLVTVYLAKAFEEILIRLGDLYYAPIVIGTFLLVGFLAERKRQM